MFECVGRKPCLFYIRRQGFGKETGEEIWDLTIATDQNHLQLPTRLEKLGKTLGFKAAVRQGDASGLKILSIYLLPPSRGNVDGYAVPFQLSLIPQHQHRLGIPPKVMAKILTMPVCGQYVPTEEQLKAWKAFLKVEERIAKARQFCVSFLIQNHGSATRQVTLEIDVNSATLDGNEENSLGEENFWERVKKAKNQDVNFSETVPTEKIRRHHRQLGTIDKIDPKNYIIQVRLESRFI